MRATLTDKRRAGQHKPARPQGAVHGDGRRQMVKRSGNALGHDFPGAGPDFPALPVQADQPDFRAALPRLAHGHQTAAVIQGNHARGKIVIHAAHVLLPELLALGAHTHNPGIRSALAKGLAHADQKSAAIRSRSYGAEAVPAIAAVSSGPEHLALGIHQGGQPFEMRLVARLGVVRHDQRLSGRQKKTAGHGLHGRQAPRPVKYLNLPGQHRCSGQHRHDQQGRAPRFRHPVPHVHNPLLHTNMAAKKSRATQVRKRGR